MLFGLAQSVAASRLTLFGIDKLKSYMNAPRFFPQTKTRKTLSRGLALAVLLSQSAATLCQATGTIIAWGANDSFQSVVPPGVTNAMAVAGGESHSVALKPDGTVVAWGFNVSGQTNVPAGLSGVAAISAGTTYSMALKSNATVVVWGGLAAAPAGLTNVTAIAGGWSHALALKNDGTVVAWGTQTNVPANVTNVIAISAGNGQSLALRADGTVVAWGDNSYGKATVPSNATNVMAIAAGGDHCLALRRDGSIVGWGRDDDGQIDVPPDAANVIAISAGALHSIALRPDGSISAWGDNTYTQLGINQTVPGYIAIAAGGYHSLAIKGDNFPVILVQPLSKNVFLTKNTTDQVVAAGAQPLSYQWQHNGTNINGATSSVLAINNFQTNDSGAYKVQVANSYGSIFSAAVTLTGIGGPPVVTVPPQNQNVICGDGASFQVTVDGSGPFNYQWQFGSTPIAGATQSSLSLVNVSTTNAGTYSVTATNAFGSVTTGAVLTVTVQPPSITSSLAASGKQGQSFSYRITALHTPLSFGAMFLPNGLGINPITGIISGTPVESGSFGTIITAANACTSDTKNLNLFIASSIPTITSPLAVAGTEGTSLNYQITATDGPTSFGAQNLPVGVFVDPATGIISGTPIYAATTASTVLASNQWGVGSATVSFRISNAQVSGISIDNVTYVYSSPYLLDFHFTLRDNVDPNLGNGLITDPRNLTAQCIEDTTPIGDETAFILARGSSKQFKGYMVLDYTASITSVSGAVDAEVAGAQYFVNQQAVDAQLGIYEFHRDDFAPINVLSPTNPTAGLTLDKNLLDTSIAGIYTNIVQGFSSGSRCFDALLAAINALPPTNRDEQHYLIFVSDGNDQSSTADLAAVITAATNNNVKIYGIGFGSASDIDLVTLAALTGQTGGRLYLASANPIGLFGAFSLASKDFQAQYILRWATLNRKTKPFMPSFTIAYQNNLVNSPTNPVTPSMTNIDNTTTPPTTNIIPAATNFIIGYYYPSSNGPPTGVVTGALRLVADAQVSPSSVTLRASYIPRYIHQINLHYRANYPCTPTLDSTNPGEILSGWSMAQTDDGSGGKLLTLSGPTNPPTPLLFPGFGPMVTFKFEDIINPAYAFSYFTNDNTLYTNTGGQSFVFETNSLSLISNFPALPFGTPIPWLITEGYPYTGQPNYYTNELDDPDHDGMPNWKEYRANTDPRNASSVFVVRRAVRQPDGRFQITFTTSTNRTYTLQSSTNLVNWQTVQSGIPGINADVTLTDTGILRGNTIFYRAAVY